MQLRQVQVNDNDYEDVSNTRPKPDSTPYREPRKQKVSNSVLFLWLPLGLLLCYIVWRVFENASEIAAEYPNFNAFLVLFLQFIIVAAIAALCILGVAALVMSRLIVRLQNNMPVSAHRIVFDADFKAMQLRSNDLYYAERKVLWENSRFWELQTLSQQNVTNPAPEPVVAPQLLQEPSKAPPSIHDLVQRGLINRSGNSVLLGMDQQETPYYAELDTLSALAIAGQPRSGKSNTAALIVLQLLLMKAHVTVCDEHAARYDSLTQYVAPLLPFVYHARTIETIVQAIEAWYAEGKARLAQTNVAHFERRVLIIDEFTALILMDKLPEPALKMLLAGAAQFAKVQCNLVYIAHQFAGKLLGQYGVYLRRITTHRLVGRTDVTDAAFLLPDRKVANQAHQLATGRVIYMSSNQPVPVTLSVPKITFEQLSVFATQLPPKPFEEPVELTEANLDDDLLATVGEDWQYTIRDLQQKYNLRTSVIIARAHELGRKR